MTAASGTARTGDPDHGTDLNNRIPRTAPGSRFPAARSSGSRPVTSRTPPAPPRRPGSARSLTRPAARHGHGSYQGNRRRQSRTPASRQNPAKPPLTRPRSFRDDTDLPRLGSAPIRRMSRTGRPVIPCLPRPSDSNGRAPRSGSCQVHKAVPVGQALPRIQQSTRIS